MPQSVRMLILLTIVLAVPIVPFVVLGESFERRVQQQLQQPLAPEILGLAVVGALAADIFLPIPSSAVSTYAGAELGIFAATLVTSVGMTLGAAIAFGLVRGLGWTAAERWVGSQDLAEMQRWSERFGPLLVVLTRPLPILAEACVVLMGATGISWRKLLLPLISANFALGLCYAIVGRVAKSHDILPVAVVVSLVVPLILTLVLRRWGRQETPPSSADRTSVDESPV